MKPSTLSAIWLISAVLFSCSPQPVSQPSGAAVLSPLETVRRLAEENRQLFNPRSGSYTDHPAEIKAILNRGYIIFAMSEQDQKPFFYKEEQTGELIGLDVEIGYEIANRMGVRAVFNRDAKNFNEVVMKVVTKEADIALSKLSLTTRRAELVRYTAPYITFRQALLVNYARAFRGPSPQRESVIGF